MKRVLLITLLLLVLILAATVPASSQSSPTHVVRLGETLATIAQQYNVTPEAIAIANNIADPNLILTGQILTIPSGAAVATANTLSAPAANPAPASGNTAMGSYTVGLGDTLGTIATRFNTTVEALMAANNLSSADFVLLGQVLRVPGAVAAGPPAPNFAPNLQGVYTCAVYHTVRPGDTLSMLAISYSTTVYAIQRTNNLAGDLIYVGQSLCMPGPATGNPAPPPTGNYANHVVRAGETLSGIAARYGVTISALVQANQIYNPSLIYVGQVLVIPAYGTPAPAPAPGQPTKPTSPQQPTKPTSPKPEDTVDVPDYTGPRDYPEAYPYGCFNPRDQFGPRDLTHDGTPPSYDPNPNREVQVTLVREVRKWCADISYGPDPDGLTSVAIETLGQPGTQVRVRVGNEVMTAVTGRPGEPNNTAYLYRALPPGIHEVEVLDGASERATIRVQAGQRAFVNFRLTSASEDPRPRSATGWSGRVVSNTGGAQPAEGVWSVIVVRAGASGLPVSIRTSSNSLVAECFTGTKPELGGGACEFGGLWPGKYTLTLEGAGIAVEVYVDGVGMAEVHFDR